MNTEEWNKEVRWTEFNDGDPVHDLCGICKEPLVWLQPEWIGGPTIWRHRNFTHRTHQAEKVRSVSQSGR